MEVLDFLAPYRGGQEIEGLNALDEKFIVKNRIRNGKVLLKYHRHADKTQKIVRECRGLILTLDGFEPVSVPMEKFGNYGEAYAPKEIDITKYRVVEKVDGTCCGMYWDQVNGKWCVQTLSQPEAHEKVNNFDMDPNAGIIAKTWSDLFWDVFRKYSGLKLLDGLDKDFTYMFELCTPWNRVVVKHDEPKLYFLGLRSKKTFLEAQPDTCVLYGLFDLPKTYKYDDLEVLLKVAREQLTDADEGFILVDDQFNRVKVKSAQYVQKHYESTVTTINSIVQIVMQNEQDEWLAVFPEFQKVVDQVVAELNRVGKTVDDYVAYAKKELNGERNMKIVADWFLGKKLRGKENFFINKYFFDAYRFGKSGVELATRFVRDGDLVARSYEFIEKSNIRELINYDPNTYSVR
jgi:hypothetical protein